jgi:hypothetical protein
MKYLPIVLLGLSSCGAPPAPSPRRSAELLRIAAEYVAYGKVDDVLRRAPYLCHAPPPPVPPRLSAAGPSTPHGRKLYHLYAKDWAAYTKVGEQPPGQVIVKESWESAGGEGELRVGEKRELFVMLKTSAEDVDSDAGWVYGTLTPDGATVTSVGRINSCMGCHRDAPKDRIFGVKF